MKIWAVVVAGGAGRRFSSDMPKQFSVVGEQFLLAYGLQTLLEHKAIAGVVVTVADVPQSPLSAYEHWLSLCARYSHKFRQVAGGAERVWSVCNGVQGLLLQTDWEASSEDYVLVHDGARPCLHPEDVSNLVTKIQALSQEPASTPFGVMLGQPVTDSLKLVQQGKVASSVDRSLYWQAQTPQGFALSALSQAFAALEAGIKESMPTDECELMGAHGVVAHCVQGTHPNPKLTYLGDLPMIESLLNAQRS